MERLESQARRLAAACVLGQRQRVNSPLLKQFVENQRVLIHARRAHTIWGNEQGQRTPKTNTGWSKCRFPEQLQVISDCALLHFDCFSDNAGHTMYY